MHVCERTKSCICNRDFVSVPIIRKGVNTLAPCITVAKFVRTLQLSTNNHDRKTILMTGKCQVNFSKQRNPNQSHIHNQILFILFYFMFTENQVQSRRVPLTVTQGSKLIVYHSYIITKTVAIKDRKKEIGENIFLAQNCHFVPTFR